MIQVDNFALVVALPSMADDLGEPTTDASWAVGAYMIAFGVALLPGGRLGDVLGRKRTMLAGLAAFTLASVAAGMAGSMGALVAWRVVQGLAGGVYSPLALSLVSTTVEPASRGRVLGVVMAAAATGTAAGPVVGGVVTASAGWRWVLLVNLPIGIAAIVWGWLQLPESHESDDTSLGLRGFDWIGAGLATAGIAAVSVGVELADRGGLTWPVGVAEFFGLAVLAGFVNWERRVSQPLIPPRLWRHPVLRLLATTCTVVYMALMVVFFVATVSAQDVRGLSPLVVGILFVPAALGRMTASLTAGRLASRGTGLGLMALSMFAGAVALAVLAVAAPLWLFVLALTAAALALGLGHQFGVVDVQVRVSGADAGAAAGVVFTLLMLAGGLAVAASATMLESASGGAVTEAGVTSVLLGWTAVLLVSGAGTVAWVRRVS